MADFIPMISICPNKIVQYSVPAVPFTRSETQIAAEKFLTEAKKIEELSMKAKKRLTTAIWWLLSFADQKRVFVKKTGKHINFKVGFVTLTLCSRQEHDDRIIKNVLLNQFFVEAKRLWDVKHFVWRAEPQKNGNIHFHILTDKFIPYWDLRKVWNRIQNKLGYVDRFQANNGHDDPNSTDVHSVAKVKNVAAYLIKYFSKNSDARVLMGRLWVLSQSLSKMKNFTNEVTYQLSEDIETLTTFLKKEWYHGTYASVLFTHLLEIPQNITVELLQKFQNYVKGWKAYFATGQLSIV